MSDEERVSPVEVVAGFIASEVGHWSPGMAEQARELIDALEAAGWQIVAGDAVVIPRSAIPDGIAVATPCLDCGGHGWDAEPHPSTGEPINPRPCRSCDGLGALDGSRPPVPVESHPVGTITTWEAG